MPENTRHTPGPWRSANRGDGTAAVLSDGWGPIAELHVPAKVRQGELTSNADLIAAAPDLLEALKELVATLRKEAPGTRLNNARFDALGAKANAAIAKAEGQS